MSEEKKGISRRNFTKSAALGGFAILSARGALAQANGDTLKVGLIGCGGRGGGAAMNCIRANENVVIVALADVFPDKLNDTRKRLEETNSPRLRKRIDITDEMCFVGLDAYKKLLATDVDIILHATPPYCRPQHIEAAVEAGKHIFTEKPVAVDAPGVRRFIAAAEKAKEKGLTFVTGTQRRHQKSYVETIPKLQDGAIGEIRAMRCYWNGTLPFANDRQDGHSDLEYRLRNWYNQIWTCGDNIVEQHIHNIDVCNWVMGDAHPIKVVGTGGRIWKPATEKYGDIYDHFVCDFEYANGVHMYSSARHFNNSHNAVFEEATGTTGVSNCHDMGKDDKDPYEQEHINMMASITGAAPYLNEGVRCAESTFTAILGRDAAYSGRELEWDDHLANGPAIFDPETLSFDTAYPVGPLPIPGEWGQA